jgi:hypothetical protein
MASRNMYMHMHMYMWHDDLNDLKPEARRL